MAPWLWPWLVAAQALAANFPPRYSLYTGGAAPHGAARAASRHRNWCAFVVTRTVSCVVEDGVESFVKADFQPCAWGQLQCPRVLAYRSFLRPRYKVAQKTVSDLEWRCCQGYSGEDCSEGPLPGPPQPTAHPRPRPGRPTLSGFGSALSGLGGEGGAGGGGGGGGRGGAAAPRSPDEAEKVRRLEEAVQRLSRQLEEQQKQLRDARRGADGGTPPADAAPPDVREALVHIQQRLQRLEAARDGAGGERGPGEGTSPEEDERLREMCAACAAGTEGLRRQQAEDRERMRALEKLVGSVDQRNREAVETVQRHVSALSARLAPPAPHDELLRRTAELERRVGALETARGAGPAPGPTLARRLTELEGRLNASRAAGPPDGDPSLRGRVANLSRALEGLEGRLREHEARLREPADLGDEEEPLEGFSVFGGAAAPWELRELRAELTDALLAFGALNDTVRGLQDTAEQHDARLRDLNAARQSLTAELDRLVAEAAERAARSEERGESAAECGETLEPRVAKLEGVCEQLEAVAGGLRAVREGLGRHVAGLWEAVRELNGTGRTHEALLEKLQAQLPRRFAALDGSVQQLRNEVLGGGRRQEAGGSAGAPRPHGPPRGDGTFRPLRATWQGWGAGPCGPPRSARRERPGGRAGFCAPHRLLGRPEHTAHGAGHRALRQGAAQRRRSLRPRDWDLHGTGERALPGERGADGAQGREAGGGAVTFQPRHSAPGLGGLPARGSGEPTHSRAAAQPRSIGGLQPHRAAGGGRDAVRRSGGGAVGPRARRAPHCVQRRAALRHPVGIPATQTPPHPLIYRHPPSLRPRCHVPPASPPPHPIPPNKDATPGFVPLSPASFLPRRFIALPEGAPAPSRCHQNSSSHPESSSSTGVESTENLMKLA